MPVNFIDVISVEYPTGEDPPSYLFQKNYQAWMPDENPGFYDVVRRLDASGVNELWLSEKPATGEAIAVYYLGEHDSLNDDGDTCTVLDHHLEIIVLIVRWAAYQELATTESADPAPTSLGMGSLELNAYRAKREYRTKLREWKATESESTTTPWQMDSYDRIYCPHHLKYKRTRSLAKPNSQTQRRLAFESRSRSNQHRNGNPGTERI